MRIQKRGLPRLLAFITLSTFLTTNVQAYPVSRGHSQPAPVQKDLDLEKITLPAELGKIQEIHPSSPQSPVVILIQDAHAIPDAQRNIQKLIDYFQRQYGISRVALEGASADLDPQIFKSFPDQETLKKTFEEYFENGELTGSGASALFNESQSVYRGVEDWSLYEQGLNFYLEAMKNQPGLSEKFTALEKDLQAKKQSVYSQELLEIDRIFEDFQKNHGDLIQVLRKLSAIKRPEKGSELALLLEETEREGQDQTSVEMEVRKIAKQVRISLKNKESWTFNQKYQDFQTSRISAGEFALYLKTITASQFSSRLSHLISNQKRMKDIEGTKFFRDFEHYVDSVKNSLIKNDQERKLDQESHQLEILGRFIRLELSREDWKEIQTGDIRPKSSVYSLLFNHFAFYQNAEKREEAMLGNLSKTLNQNTLFIAGGFHAEGITQRLKEKGISYLLVMPQIGSMPETNHYRDHMKGEVSWKNYFEIENGSEAAPEGEKINLYKAFVRGTRDKLLKQSKDDSGKLLKSWRDQIIRDLAQKENLSSAGNYTKFIDEVIEKGNPNSLLSERLRKVDAFFQKLRGLESTGQLTEQNVLKLLRPATIPVDATTANFQPNAIGFMRGAGASTFSSRKTLSATTTRSARRRSEMRIAAKPLPEDREVSLNFNDLPSRSAMPNWFKWTVRPAQKLNAQFFRQVAQPVDRVTVLKDGKEDIEATTKAKIRKLIGLVRIWEKLHGLSLNEQSWIYNTLLMLGSFRNAVIFYEAPGRDERFKANESVQDGYILALNRRGLAENRSDLIMHAIKKADEFLIQRKKNAKKIFPDSFEKQKRFVNGEIYIGLGTAYKNQYVHTRMLLELKGRQKSERLKTEEEDLLNQLEKAYRIYFENDPNFEYLAENAQRALKASEIFYRLAYGADFSYYSGVNVMRTFIYQGRKKEAQQFARLVRESALMAEKRAFWPLATMLETAIVQENREEIKKWLPLVLAKAKSPSEAESLIGHLELWAESEEVEKQELLKLVASLLRKHVKGESLDSQGVSEGNLDILRAAKEGLENLKQRSAKDHKPLEEIIEETSFHLGLFFRSIAVSNNVRTGGLVPDLLLTPTEKKIFLEVLDRIGVLNERKLEEVDKRIDQFLSEIFELVNPSTNKRDFEDLKGPRHRENIDEYAIGRLDAFGVTENRLGATNLLIELLIGMGVDCRDGNFAKDFLLELWQQELYRKDYLEPAYEEFKKAEFKKEEEENFDRYNSYLDWLDNKKVELGEFMVIQGGVRGRLAANENNENVVIEKEVDGRKVLLPVLRADSPDERNVESHTLTAQVIRLPSGKIQIIFRDVWYQELYPFGNLVVEVPENIRTIEEFWKKGYIAKIRVWNPKENRIEDLEISFAPKAYGLPRDVTPRRYLDGEFYFNGLRVEIGNGIDHPFNYIVKLLTDRNLREEFRKGAELDPEKRGIKPIVDYAIDSGRPILKAREEVLSKADFFKDQKIYSAAKKEKIRKNNYHQLIDEMMGSSYLHWTLEPAARFFAEIKNLKEEKDQIALIEGLLAKHGKDPATAEKIAKGLTALFSMQKSDDVDREKVDRIAEEMGITHEEARIIAALAFGLEQIHLTQLTMKAENNKSYREALDHIVVDPAKSGLRDFSLSGIFHLVQAKFDTAESSALQPFWLLNPGGEWDGVFNYIGNNLQRKLQQTIADTRNIHAQILDLINDEWKDEPGETQNLFRLANMIPFVEKKIGEMPEYDANRPVAIFLLATLKSIQKSMPVMSATVSPPSMRSSFPGIYDSTDGFRSPRRSELRGTDSRIRDTDQAAANIFMPESFYKNGRDLVEQSQDLVNRAILKVFQNQKPNESSPYRFSSEKEREEFVNDFFQAVADELTDLKLKSEKKIEPETIPKIRNAAFLNSELGRTFRHLYSYHEAELRLIAAERLAKAYPETFAGDWNKNDASIRNVFTQRIDFEKFLLSKTKIGAAFSGGGAKGAAYGGAVRALSESKLWFAELAGTSAGAITAALLAVGYLPAEIANILQETDFNKFKDGESYLPQNGALHKGNKFMEWLDELLQRKMGFSPTFKDLRIPLTIIATDRNVSEKFEMNEELTPDVEVVKAARASMSIPGFFQPYELSFKDREMGEDKSVVLWDGGAVSNAPVSALKKQYTKIAFLFDPEKGKLDVKLLAAGLAAVLLGIYGLASMLGIVLAVFISAAFFAVGLIFGSKVQSELQLINDLFKTMMRAYDLHNIYNKSNAIPIILKTPASVRTTSFKLTASKKEQLDRSGYYGTKISLRKYGLIQNGRLIPKFGRTIVKKRKNQEPNEFVNTKGINRWVSGIFQGPIDVEILISKLKEMEAEGIWFSDVRAADPQGAVVAFVIALGYDAEQTGERLRSMFMKQKKWYSKIKKERKKLMPILQTLAMLTNTPEAAMARGVRSEGAPLVDFGRSAKEQVKNLTFSDLPIPLVLYGIDVSSHQVISFSPWKNSPVTRDLVLEAMKIAMRGPLEPIVTKKKDRFIGGGLLDLLPLMVEEARGEINSPDIRVFMQEKKSSQRFLGQLISALRTWGSEPFKESAGMTVHVLKPGAPSVRSEARSLAAPAVSAEESVFNQTLGDYYKNVFAQLESSLLSTEPGKRIFVVSGLPGTGKSSFTQRLGASLQKNGRDAIALEGDWFLKSKKFLSLNNLPKLIASLFLALLSKLFPGFISREYVIHFVKKSFFDQNKLEDFLKQINRFQDQNIPADQTLSFSLRLPDSTEVKDFRIGRDTMILLDGTIFRSILKLAIPPKTLLLLIDRKTAMERFIQREIKTKGKFGAWLTARLLVNRNLEKVYQEMVRNNEFDAVVDIRQPGEATIEMRSASSSQEPVSPALGDQPRRSELRVDRQRIAGKYSEEHGELILNTSNAVRDFAIRLNELRGNAGKDNPAKALDLLIIATEALVTQLKAFQKVFDSYLDALFLEVGTEQDRIVNEITSNYPRGAFIEAMEMRSNYDRFGRKKLENEIKFPGYELSQSILRLEHLLNYKLKSLQKLMTRLFQIQLSDGTSFYHFLFEQYVVSNNLPGLISEAMKDSKGYIPFIIEDIKAKMNEQSLRFAKDGDHKEQFSKAVSYLSEKSRMSDIETVTKKIPARPLPFQSPENRQEKAILQMVPPALHHLMKMDTPKFRKVDPKVWDRAATPIQRARPDKYAFIVIGVAEPLLRVPYDLIALDSALDGYSFDISRWKNMWEDPAKIEEKTTFSGSYVRNDRSFQHTDTWGNFGFIVEVPSGNLLGTSIDDLSTPIGLDQESVEALLTHRELIGPKQILKYAMKREGQTEIYATGRNGNSKAKITGVFFKADSSGRPLVSEKRLQELKDFTWKYNFPEPFMIRETRPRSELRSADKNVDSEAGMGLTIRGLKNKAVESPRSELRLMAGQIVTALTEGEGKARTPFRELAQRIVRKKGMIDSLWRAARKIVAARSSGKNGMNKKDERNGANARNYMEPIDAINQPVLVAYEISQLISDEALQQVLRVALGASRRNSNLITRLTFPRSMRRQIEGQKFFDQSTGFVRGDTQITIYSKQLKNSEEWEKAETYIHNDSSKPVVQITASFIPETLNSSLDINGSAIPLDQTASVLTAAYVSAGVSLKEQFSDRYQVVANHPSTGQSRIRPDALEGLRLLSGQLIQAQARQLTARAA